MIRFHLSTLIVVIIATNGIALVNSSSDLFTTNEGYIEQNYGWPLPAFGSAYYVECTDKTIFCCSRDGGFSVDHYQAHPEMYSPLSSDTGWMWFWPFLTVDMVVALLILAAVALAWELSIRRFGRTRFAHLAAKGSPKSAPLPSAMEENDGFNGATQGPAP